MLYEANYFANSHGLRKLNSSPINDMSSSSSSSAEPSLSPISKNNDSNFRNHQHYHHSSNASIEKPPKKAKRSTVREVIENKLKRSHINALIKHSDSLNNDTEWLNNSNEENLNHHYTYSDKQNSRNKSINNKMISNNLPYIINENDISNYLDMHQNTQQQQQPFRRNSLNQNDSVQNFSINSHADVDVSAQYLNNNNNENSFYLNNMMQHHSNAGCTMENEFSHYAQYTISENSNTLIPIYQHVPIELTSAHANAPFNSDNTNHTDYTYNNLPQVSTYEPQYTHQYYHHANEYQQQDSASYPHVNYYQYQDENNQMSNGAYFLNREIANTTNGNAPNYTTSHFNANSVPIEQNEADIDNSYQQYAHNSENISYNAVYTPQFQMNDIKASSLISFNASQDIRSISKDDSFYDNDDDFSSVISQDEIMEEMPKETIKSKAKTKTKPKKTSTKKLSKLLNNNDQSDSNELNVNENSNSTESFLNNSTLYSNQQYIQSQLEGVTCKRKRKRILNRLQRAEATMREKRRMLKLNRAFEELRKVLPVSDFAKNKLSRAETLKSAIEYIENMSELLSI